VNPGIYFDFNGLFLRLTIWWLCVRLLIVKGEIVEGVLGGEIRDAGGEVEGGL